MPKISTDGVLDDCFKARVTDDLLKAARARSQKLNPVPRSLPQTLRLLFKLYIRKEIFVSRITTPEKTKYMPMVQSFVPTKLKKDLIKRMAEDGLITQSFMLGLFSSFVTGAYDAALKHELHNMARKAQNIPDGTNVPPPGKPYIALDLDVYEHAEKWLAKNGFTLQEFFSANYRSDFMFNRPW